jgi:hypothetical protein
VTHPELLSWLNGFLAAKGKAPWLPEDFKRVRTVLDEAEQAAKPKQPPVPFDANMVKHALAQRPLMQQEPPWPLSPAHLGVPSNQCAVCNMKFDGPMGYVCPNPNCPSRVVCGSPA